MIWDKTFSVIWHFIIPFVSIFVVGLLVRIIVEAYQIEQELKQ